MKKMRGVRVNDKVYKKIVKRYGSFTAFVNKMILKAGIK